MWYFLSFFSPWWYNNISRKVFTNLISMIMVFNTPFNQYFCYIVVVSLIGLRKPEYPEYTTYLSQVTDKPCHGGGVYSIQHNVIKFVGDLRWLTVDSWFSSGTPVSSSNNIPTGKVWPMVSIIVLWIWLLFIILNLLSLVLFSIDIKIDYGV
jgi:hypothetical protein